jgi:WD40 repeat protein
LRPLTPSLLASEALIRRSRGTRAGVSALALLADGQLASGSRDGTIKLWNAATGGCEATLAGHTFQVDALALLAYGRLVSLGVGDKTIRLWEHSHEGRIVLVWFVADARIAALAFLRRAAVLAVGDVSGRVHPF